MPKKTKTNHVVSKAEAKTKEKPMLRAVKVSKEILEASKAYRKAKGVSFYTLGLEAISDRLSKEGFLKKSGQ